MKTDRHGQAKILTSDEIQRLFETGFTCDRKEVCQIWKEAGLTKLMCINLVKPMDSPTPLKTYF